MNVRPLLAQLIAQRQRLQDVIDALTALEGEKAPKSRRTMSPQARRRIAAAMKKRWAERKKKPSAKASAAVA